MNGHAEGHAEAHAEPESSTDSSAEVNLIPIARSCIHLELQSY